MCLTAVKFRVNYLLNSYESFLKMNFTILSIFYNCTRIIPIKRQFTHIRQTMDHYKTKVWGLKYNEYVLNNDQQFGAKTAVFYTLVLPGKRVQSYGILGQFSFLINLIPNYLMLCFKQSCYAYNAGIFYRTS